MRWFREPSAILLVAQLAALAFYPFMEGNEVGRALFAKRSSISTRPAR
jgi:hypothetical protein